MSGSGLKDKIADFLVGPNKAFSETMDFHSSLTRSVQPLLTPLIFLFICLLIQTVQKNNTYTPLKTYT